MSESDSIPARVRVLCETKLNLPVPETDTDLFAVGALDSLAFVDLLMHLEEEFGIPIDLEYVDLDEVRSIGEIATLVERRLAAPRRDRIGTTAGAGAATRPAGASAGRGG